MSEPTAPGTGGSQQPWGEPPRHPGPMAGAPQYGGPQYGGPQYGGLEHGGPPYGAPQYGGPQHGGPPYGGPRDGGAPAGPPGPWPPPQRASWAGLRNWRSDLRPAVVLVLVLAAAGLLAGLVWWWLAPRADYTITSAGPQPVGDVSQELLIADDSVYVLVMSVLGLLAGIGGWLLLRHRRGVPLVVAVGLGTLAASALAWQLGELLGRGPTEAQLADVGATVTTALRLEALAALAAGPFVAVLVYLLATVFARDDDLGRPEGAEAGLPAVNASPGAPLGTTAGSGLDRPSPG